MNPARADADGPPWGASADRLTCCRSLWEMRLEPNICNARLGFSGECPRANHRRNAYEDINAAAGNTLKSRGLVYRALAGENGLSRDSSIGGGHSDWAPGMDFAASPRAGRPSLLVRHQRRSKRVRVCSQRRMLATTGVTCIIRRPSPGVCPLAPSAPPEKRFRCWAVKSPASSLLLCGTAPRVDLDMASRRSFCEARGRSVVFDQPTPSLPRPLF